MAQASEQLDLPVEIYRTLEQIAQHRRMPPATVVERLLQQFQITENLRLLREEYQSLTDKALARTITNDEEERLEEICTQISAINRQSEQGRIVQQRNKKADKLIANAERLLETIRSQSKKNL